MPLVPNTNTFTLQDVCNVVGGTTLQEAFYYSESKYFDPTYSGSKDRLSNFRNYGYNEVSLNVIESASRYMYFTAGTWQNVRDSLFGTIGNLTDYFVTTRRSSDGYTYRLDRTFFKFDLSGISGTCFEAYLLLPLIEKIGSGSLKFTASSQYDPITSYNYNEIGDISIFNGGYSQNGNNDSVIPYYLKVYSTSSDITNYIQPKFGSNLLVGVRETADFSNLDPNPGTDNSFHLFRSGEGSGGQPIVTNVTLVLKYR